MRYGWKRKRGKSDDSVGIDFIFSLFFFFFPFSRNRREIICALYVVLFYLHQRVKRKKSSGCRGACERQSKATRTSRKGAKRIFMPHAEGKLGHRLKHGYDICSALLSIIEAEQRGDTPFGRARAVNDPLQDGIELPLVVPRIRQDMLPSESSQPEALQEILPLLHFENSQNETRAVHIPSPEHLSHLRWEESTLSLIIGSSSSFFFLLLGRNVRLG